LENYFVPVIVSSGSPSFSKVNGDRTFADVLRSKGTCLKKFYLSHLHIPFMWLREISFSCILGLNLTDNLDSGESGESSDSDDSGMPARPFCPRSTTQVKKEETEGTFKFKENIILMHLIYMKCFL
jgi:hypothetical protein